MWGHKERPLREQLEEAREKIAAQIEELHFRKHAGVGGAGGPPDYRSVIAQLEAELREIDDLLDDEGVDRT